MSVTKVPTIPPVGGGNTDYILTNVKMLLDVREGRSGDKLDANVTYRDLVSLGLANDPSGQVVYIGKTASLSGLPVQPSGVDSDGYDPTKDLTPPPAPTDVVAQGSIGVVFLTWNQPTYRNHAYAEIWRSESDDVATASLVGTSSTQGYVDVPNDQLTRYYWIRFVSRADVRGPYSQESASAKADIDPAVIIAKIEGQILDSSLSKTLSERIKRIESGVDIQTSIQSNVALLQRATNTAITNEQTVRENADSALSQSIQTLTATVGDNNTALSALITSEETARVSADTALASSISVVGAIADAKTRSFYQDTAPVLDPNDPFNVGDLWVDTNITYADDYLPGDYVIRSNRMNRWDGTQWVEAMDFGFADWFTAIRDEKTARVNGDGALAQQITNLTSVVDANYATLQQEQTTRANADAALSSDITTLTSTVNTNNSNLTAALQSEASTRASADTALASDITTLISTVNTNNSNLTAALQSEATTRANADSALSSNITTLTSTVNTNNQTLTAALQTEATTRADADTALSSDITTLTSTNQTLAAALQTEATTRADADTALSNNITTLESTVNTNNQTLTTALQTEATTRANADGSLFAQYTVKIDSNGHVSGFGLASETVSGTTTSAFIVRADKFAIVDPASTSNNLTNSPSADTVPFSIVGGVTYLKSAMIQDASISSAKIASLVANKITSGYINAAVGINGAKVYGAELYAGGSTTVTTDGSGNVTGFTAVNPTVNISGGNASFVAGNFSVKNSSTGSAYVPFTVNGGVVYLNTAFIGDGTITNAKIGSTIQSTSYTAGSAGWKIDKDGASEFNSNVTFRGSLNVKSASSGARMEMTNSVLKVYDSSGTLRVKIGDLTA